MHLWHVPDFTHVISFLPKLSACCPILNKCLIAEGRLCNFSVVCAQIFTPIDLVMLKDLCRREEAGPAEHLWAQSPFQFSVIQSDVNKKINEQELPFVIDPRIFLMETSSLWRFSFSHFSHCENSGESWKKIIFLPWVMLSFQSCLVFCSSCIFHLFIEILQFSFNLLPYLKHHSRFYFEPLTRSHITHVLQNTQDVLPSMQKKFEAFMQSTKMHAAALFPDEYLSPGTANAFISFYSNEIREGHLAMHVTQRLLPKEKP